MSMALQLGDQFTGKYESYTRKFRAFIKNVTVTENGDGTATVKIGSAGLRKTEGGATEVQTGGSTRIAITLTGLGGDTHYAQSNLNLSGTAPVDANIVTNVSWVVNQTSSAQTLTISFKYAKNSGTAWAGTSSGSLSITIPAYDTPTNEVMLTNLLSQRSGNYIVTTFTVTGEWDIVPETTDGATVYINDLAFTATRVIDEEEQPTNDFICSANMQPVSATVRVSATVTPTGKDHLTLTDRTFISGTSVAIDFYSPKILSSGEAVYNVGIGTTAYGSYWGDNGRVDIAGDVFVNNSELQNVDAVVASGYDSTTGWSYRKWSSGQCELWRTYTAALAMTTSYNGCYSTDAARSLTLPFAVYNGACFGSGAAEGNGVVVSISSSDATSFAYRPYRHSSSASKSRTFFFRIDGTWR